METARERGRKEQTMDHPFRVFRGRSLAHGVVALGLVMGVQTMHAQSYPAPYGERVPHSGAVAQTMEDLQRVAQVNGVYSSRERERFDNALRHLAQFQDRMRRREFDKDKLDQAIEDVQNIVHNNRLDRRAKSLLWRDLSALRNMRARYDHR